MPWCCFASAQSGLGHGALVRSWLPPVTSFRCRLAREVRHPAPLSPHTFVLAACSKARAKELKHTLKSDKTSPLSASKRSLLRAEVREPPYSGFAPRGSGFDTLLQRARGWHLGCRPPRIFESAGWQEAVCSSPTAVGPGAGRGRQWLRGDGWVAGGENAGVLVQVGSPCSGKVQNTQIKP